MKLQPLDLLSFTPRHGLRVIDGGTTLLVREAERAALLEGQPSAYSLAEFAETSRPIGEE